MIYLTGSPEEFGIQIYKHQVSSVGFAPSFSLYRYLTISLLSQSKALWCVNYDLIYIHQVSSVGFSPSFSLFKYLTISPLSQSKALWCVNYDLLDRIAGGVRHTNIYTSSIKCRIFSKFLTV